MTVKVGSTVKTTHKTKLINKGEIGTVKEIYDLDMLHRRHVLISSLILRKRTM